MALQKLPIGIQTFSKIREDDYIYIDKTEIAYDLIESYQYVFLSRPRRFGKSLFLDTLKNIFEGNKEYFSGLAIEPKWDWSVRYPVIKISFDSELRSAQMVRETLYRTLRKNQEALGVECETTDNVSICLSELIQKVHDKYSQKVVVLVDEYDKAILDNLDQMDVAREAREIIKGFYTVLKGSDEYLKFVFLTGVSKFSRASIFSGLNNITDISLHPDFGDICGYTQTNIEKDFKEHLEGVDLEKLKKWYNGYNFLKSNMYNPFDLLKFIQFNYIYDNYWFESGTPTFLMKLIEQNNYFLPNLSNLVVDNKILHSFDIENLDLEVILYQSGYLTIDEVLIDEDFGTIEYKLKIPNFEVKKSLNDHIIYSFFSHENSLQKTKPIYYALKSNDLEAFKKSLSSIFASIPYSNFTNNSIQNYEGFYASVIYVYLQSLGLDIVGEDVTNKGRIDLTIKMDHAIFILEFKVDGKRGDALQQIKEKKYHEKYLSEKKDIYLLGIEFSKEQMNIASFEWQKV